MLVFVRIYVMKDICFAELCKENRFMNR